MVNRRQSFPLFFQVISFNWIARHRFHLWSEFVNDKGVKIQIVIIGQLKDLTENERLFIDDIAKSMDSLNKIN